MKKIFILLCLVILLSGCTIGEKIRQNKLDKTAKSQLENRTPSIKFNLEDFSYEGNECWDKNFFESIFCIQGKQIYYKFIPKSGFKFLYVNSNLDLASSKQSSTIIDLYYADYVLNDFIFDQTKGNKLDEMFLYLEEKKINYHISSEYVMGMQFIDIKAKGTNPIAYRDYLHFTSLEYSNNSFTNVFFVNDKTKLPTDEEYIKYIENQDMSTINFYKYMKFCNYTPYLKIFIENDSLSEDDLNQLRENLKFFYNTSELEIDFERIDVKEKLEFFTDSAKTYDKYDLDKGYIPVYKWSK